MAVKVQTRKGKTITLLNPAEKGRKFVAELKAGVHGTNDQKVKRDKDGNKMPLSKTDRAYRAGYLDSRKDGAKAFKSKHKKNLPAVVSYTIVDGN